MMGRVATSFAAYLCAHLEDRVIVDQLDAIDEMDARGDAQEEA